MQLQEQKGSTGQLRQLKDFVTKLTEFGISARAAQPVSAARLGNAAHAAPELLAKVCLCPSCS